ncbi:MAG: hypothetical protein QOI34_835, partial [Verrucomicrobiota bacterium]
GELARITGVYGNLPKADPASALGNLFGKLPLSRTPLMKVLTVKPKHGAQVLAKGS